MDKLWHSLEAMFMASQRSCERSDISKPPFHEIAGNVDIMPCSVKLGLFINIRNWESRKHGLSYVYMVSCSRVSPLFDKCPGRIVSPAQQNCIEVREEGHKYDISFGSFVYFLCKQTEVVWSQMALHRNHVCCCLQKVPLPR